MFYFPSNCSFIFLICDQIHLAHLPGSGQRISPTPKNGAVVEGVGFSAQKEKFLVLGAAML